MNRKFATFIIATFLLPGCRGGWTPWSGSSSGGEARIPPGATAYACDGSKRLLVRFQPESKSVWVIYPDREFRLDRIESASGEQFSNGNTVLTVKGGEATLREGTTLAFSGCKADSGSR